MIHTRLTALATAACVALAASSLAQGLGDAAKTEKKRRTEASTPAKTYTLDDVLDLPPVANSSDGLITTAPAPVSPRPTTGASRTTATSSSKRDARRDDELVWRGRLNQARAAVEKARATHEKVSAMYLVPGYRYEDKKGRPVIESVEELQALTARAKADLDAAERHLADLLERGRRAGVPAGWLR